MCATRNVTISVVIPDPEEGVDDLPVSDQNARLAALHRRFVIHKKYLRRSTPCGAPA